jgi:hypothetical protein
MYVLEESIGIGWLYICATILVSSICLNLILFTFMFTVLYINIRFTSSKLFKIQNQDSNDFLNV